MQFNKNPPRALLYRPSNCQCIFTLRSAEVRAYSNYPAPGLSANGMRPTAHDESCHGEIPFHASPVVWFMINESSFARLSLRTGKNRLLTPHSGGDRVRPDFVGLKR